MERTICQAMQGLVRVVWHARLKLLGAVLAGRVHCGGDRLDEQATWGRVSEGQANSWGKLVAVGAGQVDSVHGEG